ncbi:MAG: hypothetical protein ACUVQ0_05735 [Thermoproteota archaeon]
MNYLRLSYMTQRIALLGVLASLAVSSNYALIMIPNVKLMDAMVFASGMIMGFGFGASLAILIWLVYGTLNPYGLSLPTLALTMMCEIVYAIFSRVAILLKKDWQRVTRYDVLLLSSLGFFSTLIYDVVTNLFVGVLFYGSALTGLLTMNFPVPMGLIHEFSNAAFFPVLIPVMYRFLSRSFNREVL